MQILGHLKNGFAGAVELINWPLYAYSTLYQAQEEQNRTVVIRLVVTFLRKNGWRSPMSRAS